MTDKIEDVRADMAIDQDRLEITDETREATTFVKSIGPAQPLSASEPTVEIITHTENGYTDLQLNAEQVDALIDALYHIQQE